MSTRSLADGMKSGRPIRLPISPFMSYLSRKCGRLNISQPCVLPQPVSGIDLLFDIILRMNIYIFHVCDTGYVF
jgi:hypothetical protein